MITTARQQHLLLEQAVEAIVPVLGVYAAGTADARPDVEAAIDRTAHTFADRIVARWHDWLKNKPPHDVLQLLTGLTGLSADQARQDAADLLDRHLLDVRPADRSFALDYLAGIPGQVKQVLVFDRASGAYQLPPGWSVGSIDGLIRFLPDAGEMKLSWARGGPKPPGTPQLQTELDAPRTVLPALDGPVAVAVTHRPSAGVVLQNSAVTTKLRLLARCHRLARWAWWKRFVVAVLALPVCIGLGVTLGAAVYMSVYDDPHRHARQSDKGWDKAGGRALEFHIDLNPVSKQEYEYFLATHDNGVPAGIAAGAAGIGLFVLTFGGWLWFLNRHRTPIKVGLDEQIQAIIQDHPDEVKSWGGPAVLHHPGLVDELLRIDDKGGR